VFYLVGDNPESFYYLTPKFRDCEKEGFFSKTIRLPETLQEKELVQHIEQLNRDETIHGILVQLPLPAHISEKAVIQKIAPEKDVDGFHPVNVGNMVIGDECYLPCTPHGIVRTGTSSGALHLP
jgi:methylenetetrahydrofolate dehydrogenase (NADP+) / methenyltetrahydrofolate cyclohydrolase